MSIRSLTNRNLLTLAKETLVGNNHDPVSAVQLNLSPYDHFLYIATPLSPSGYYGFDGPSASFDPDQAQFDAIMRTFARHVALNRPKKLIVSKATQLKYPYLDPEVYAPLEKDRAAERALRPFSRTRRTHWVIGVTFDGHPRYVPADLVYRGSPVDAIYITNASGTAAHSDPLEAVKLATLSRIKADACMRTWYKALAPYRLKPELLPKRAASRVEMWREIGRTLTLSQLDNDYGEVYLATIRGNNFPCFACGVGATIDGDTEAALLEALANVEMNYGVLASYRERGWQTGIDLATPLDHGLLYAERENLEKLEFLDSREELTGPFHRQPVDLFELIKELELTVVWLTEPQETFQAVRVFSPRLVPLSYGRGLEHSDHAALREHGGMVAPENVHIRHCFMNL